VCDHALLTTDTDVPFAAQIVIDRSRFPAPTGNATPGANPPCEQRIVTPIPAPITLSQSGTLILHVDPTALFLNADLGCLTQYSKDPPSYGIPNDESTQPSRNLYSNLRSAGAVYRFEFRPASP
jgi:hypothetical protein